MAIEWDALVLGPAMAAFGQLVTYRPSTGRPFDIPDAVFDRYHREVRINDDGAPVSTMRPVLGVRDAVFPSGVPAAQGDQVVVDNLYEIIDTQPDGHGHTLLILKVAR